MFKAVGKLKIFRSLTSLIQSSEDEPLEDWEKGLKWLKSLQISSVKVPSLDSVNSEIELYHYLKVIILSLCRSKFILNISKLDN